VTELLITNRTSPVALVLAILVSACASSPAVVKTLHEPAYRDAIFRNYLVIAVTENYDVRAQFERQLVSAIRTNGAAATAYYTVVGNKPPVTRESIATAIREGGFDAVLLTRVKGLENKVEVHGAAPETKTTRRSGTAFDLFRYDYEELNDPDSVQIETTIVLVSELYAAADEKKVWAIESSVSSSEGAGVLIDTEVETIIRQLQKDKLLGR
jgi:hypothetical protein